MDEAVGVSKTSGRTIRSLLVARKRWATKRQGYTTQCQLARG